MSRYRTLLRVQDIKDDLIFFILPGRDSDRISEINISDIPDNILPFIKIGSRLFVNADLDKDDLELNNWELP